MSIERIPVDEAEAARLVELSDSTHPIPLSFGPGRLALDLTDEADRWILVVLSDWRGIEVSPELRAARPLPPHVAATHVVPDATSNRAGAS